MNYNDTAHRQSWDASCSVMQSDSTMYDCHSSQARKIICCAYGRPIDEYAENSVELSHGALCKYSTNDLLRSIAGRCCTAYRRDVAW